MRINVDEDFADCDIGACTTYVMHIQATLQQRMRHGYKSRKESFYRRRFFFGCVM